MFFSSFLDRSLNCVNPEIIEFSLVLIGYFALGTFRRRSLFRSISINFGTIFASIFHQFPWLFQHRFSHLFFHRFFMENGSKMTPKIEGGTPPEPHLFATFSEGWFLDAFSSSFGFFWAPFWLPLAPFGVPLAPFWHPLAPFWHPLAPFWLFFGSLLAPFPHFGWLWNPFGSIWLPSASVSRTSSHF